MTRQATPDKTLKETILIIKNAHVPGTIPPPSVVVDGSTKQYVSYFENVHGEQLIFVHDYESHFSKLYHGDMGWEPTPVIFGTVPIIISAHERIWLAACCAVVEEVERMRSNS